MDKNTDNPRNDAPFDRFEDAVGESLTVPKSELNKQLAEAKAERAKARAERKAKPAALAPIGTASSDRA